MRKQSAIIIGGSVAGLLAARTLSDHFEQVTIVERDKLPTEAEFRSGVPQGRHIHVLLSRGRQILEVLFPGFDAELDALGVPLLDWGMDYAGLNSKGWIKTYEPGLILTRTATRLTLEYVVRKRLNQIKNINTLEQTDVEALLTDATNRQVIGVQTRSRADQSTSALMADLVIDASGRNSKAPDWLQALGYAAPEVSQVNSHVGYATRLYEAEPGVRWKFVAVGPRPAEKLLRGGGIMLVEGNRWLATMMGMNADYPPTDEEGFLDYSRTAASPILYDFLKNAVPLGPVYGYRIDGSRRRHFERLARRPDRFLVAGDALCSFNPVYGQGMTTAALESLALGKLLDKYEGRDLTGFTADAQKVIFEQTKDAWLMATGEDLRYPGTEGNRPGAASRLVQRYTDKVVEAAAYDPAVTFVFSEVLQMLKPPTALFAPGIVTRVARYALSSGKSSQSEKVPELLMQP